MPKFRAWGKVVGSKYLGEFEASDSKDAARKAEDLCHVYLCSSCADEVEDPEIEDIIVEESSVVLDEGEHSA